ncbi:3-isopropylmalate dehydratase small subunit [Desulfosudis oleivorans]|uniref:Aconitate hydratase domain protein n=1 Tax=Desulfosudis oleivorans (strain DSM 6200 / JCM 39069 / Hxd3) TaxID=96561 RepID=A9A042_DESOH|nr:3-isopropylmalate dehydratase small subunit [Desulfosudis oleivorans]ABW68961.1 aconitate hydratase domain protein [Desulfosudis oleivorans Hxd3]
MESFDGKILFLDRSDINTDEIIPAKYLTEISKQALGPHLLEDLALEGFDPARDLKGKGVILTRANFGCGSSREHAAWALEVNNIDVVIAESFSRIFRQNMYNCGMLAAELPAKTINELFKTFAGRDVQVETDLERSVFVFTAKDIRKEVPFSLGGFDRALIEAGGWLNYADERY